jgi:Short C-terminal domain
MLLVPRQLQRAGMTGDVPYYGGRLTPAQAYAASHAAPRPQPAPEPSSPRPPERKPLSAEERLARLEELRDAGTISDVEFEELRSRVVD